MLCLPPPTLGLAAARHWPWAQLARPPLQGGSLRTALGSGGMAGLRPAALPVMKLRRWLIQSGSLKTFSVFGKLSYIRRYIVPPTKKSAIF